MEWLSLFESQLLDSFPTSCLAMWSFFLPPWHHLPCCEQMASPAMFWADDITCHVLIWWCHLPWRLPDSKYTSLFSSYLVLGNFILFYFFQDVVFLWTLTVLEQDQASLDLRDPSDSTSQVLESKICTTTTWLVFYYRNRKWFVQGN